MGGTYCLSSGAEEAVVEVDPYLPFLGDALKVSEKVSHSLRLPPIPLLYKVNTALNPMKSPADTNEGETATSANLHQQN